MAKKEPRLGDQSVGGIKVAIAKKWGSWCVEVAPPMVKPFCLHWSHARALSESLASLARRAEEREKYDGKTDSSSPQEDPDREIRSPGKESLSG